ncbi:MerR family DNA-binding transcriptional regulator [Candidatus Uhrbacteria bacterium]|nr:MerR family DNA-binding transcriptional regulator [Candidatus Uhrbacteria bacterium]
MKASKKNEIISIGEAAKILGVSQQTLRRWDEKGFFPSIRIHPTGNRQYQRQEIAEFIRKKTMQLFYMAENWASDHTGRDPQADFYCQNSGVFHARIGMMEALLMRMHGFEQLYSIITSTTGEIGNNSFDHNLVNWPDIPGIFFGYNLDQRYIVLADRGQGILTTLRRVRPELKNHAEALYLAFTETITGRAPERRGNELKYVRNNIMKYPLTLLFRTGNAELSLRQGDTDIIVKSIDKNIRGCLALITF